MSNNIFTINRRIPTIAASLGRIISGETIIECQFIEIQNYSGLKTALQDIFLGFFNTPEFNNAILVPTSFLSKVHNFFSPNFKIAYIQDALNFLKRVDSKCYSQVFQGFKVKDYTGNANSKDGTDLKTAFETRVKKFFTNSTFDTRAFFQAYEESLFISMFDTHIKTCLAALIFNITQKQSKQSDNNNTEQEMSILDTKTTLVTTTLIKQKILPIGMAHAISAIDEDVKRRMSQASQISLNPF